METIQIRTLVGDLIEVTCVPTRQGIVRALNAMDEERFPLLETDAIHLEDGGWFAMVVPHPSGITWIGFKSFSTKKTKDAFIHTYEWGLSPECFVPVSLTEETTERQRAIGTYGDPMSVKVIESTSEEHHPFSLSHVYRDQMGIIQTACSDTDHLYTTLEDLLSHCCHSVKDEGTGRQLRPEVVAYVLRTYEVMYQPFPIK